MGMRYDIYKDEINHKDFFRPSCLLFHGIVLNCKVWKETEEDQKISSS